jgi:hypothetical protein
MLDGLTDPVPEDEGERMMRSVAESCGWDIIDPEFEAKK